MNKSQEDETLIDRFELKFRLGQGGYGVVYQAYDREKCELVALKLLHQAKPEALYRFKLEFRTLANLHHPNLITLYELISEGDRWFFTMELINGDNFLDYMRIKRVFNNEVEEVSPNSSETNQEELTSLHTKSKQYTKIEIPTTLEEQTNSEILAKSEVFTKSEILTSSEVFTNSNIENITIIDKNDFNIINNIKETVAPNIPTTTQRPKAKKISVNLDRLRYALKQLTEGLMALHSAGKLHRDIKPSNVMVSEEGRVVILDFGLVHDFGPNQSFGQIAGTPAYMSPEQASGLPLSEASDWYSVGIMLYIALTGTPPFTGTWQQILVDKKTKAPEPPSKYVVDVPEDLNTLCIELISRDPDKRPSGNEILKRLGLESVNLDSSLDKQSRSRYKIELIGRERHFNSLYNAFQKVKQGSSVTVYLNGISGMGKTILSQRFLEDIQDIHSKALILSGACYEQESVPYKALDGVVDNLSKYLKSLSNLEVEAFLPIDILALTKLFPVLLQVHAISESRRAVLNIPDSIELKRRAFAALKELLTRIAIKKPLILFIDDLQWGDIDSSTLIENILGSPDPPPLLLILSYRKEEVQNSPSLQTLLSIKNMVGLTTEIVEIEVGELSFEESKKLALMLLRNANSINEAEKIAKESAGSPFFVNELTSFLKLGRSIEELKLEEVIQAHIQELPQEARKLLEIIAVSGQPIERSVAKQAAELETDENKLLAILRANHMLRATGKHDQLATYHDRIRETIVAFLPEDILKQKHKRLALALEATGKADSERLGDHFYKSGDKDKAIDYTIKAADQAVETLAFNRAARLYSFALDLKETDDYQSDNLRIKLADALVNAGRGAEAAQFYLKASEKRNGIESLELRQCAAEQFLRSGHIDKGKAVLRTVLEEVGLKFPKSPRRAFLSLVLRKLVLRLRGLNFKQRDISVIDTKEIIKIDTCRSIVVGLALVDTIQAAYFQSIHILLALKTGETRRIIRALVHEAGFTSIRGSRSQPKCENLLNKAKSLLGQNNCNEPYEEGILKFTIGLANYYFGKWSLASDSFDEAVEILRNKCTGVAWELNTSKYYKLRSLYNMGSWKKLIEQFPAFLKEVQEQGDLYSATTLFLKISFILPLAADSPNEAAENLEKAIDKWAQKGFHVQHFFAMWGQAQVDLYVGKYTSALERVNNSWQVLNRSMILNTQLNLIEALHLRARCLLSVAIIANNREKLISEVDKISKKIEQEKTPWANNLALLIRAGVNSIQDKKEAINLLERAEKGFNETDMALYSAISRRRRGQLIGGETGRILIEEADNFMHSQLIKNPELMANMLAPGKWS